MDAKKFIEDLQVIVGAFESRATEFGVISEKGVEIKLGQKFIVLRLVVQNGDDTIVCDQDVELREMVLCPQFFQIRIF